MKEVSAAIERLRFAVRTLPGVLAGFSEAEADSPIERYTLSHSTFSVVEEKCHLLNQGVTNHVQPVRRDDRC